MPTPHAPNSSSCLKPKRGLTLLEILVASMLMITIMAGIASIFISVRKHTQHSRSRMAGGTIGKLFIEPLQEAVRQDTWGDPANALAVGVTYCGKGPANPACPPDARRRVANVVYDAMYNITDLAPNLRKVQLKVKWQEPQQ